MALDIGTSAKCCVCVTEEPMLETTIYNMTALKHKINSYKV